MNEGQMINDADIQQLNIAGVVGNAKKTTA